MNSTKTTWPHHFTKREVWAHTTNLTLPLFVEVPVPSQGYERWCKCVLVVSIWPLATIFLLDIETVPTVWYFWLILELFRAWYFFFYWILELFPQCGIFCLILELFWQCCIFLFFYILELFRQWQCGIFFVFLDLFRQCGIFCFSIGFWNCSDSGIFLFF